MPAREIVLDYQYTVLKELRDFLDRHDPQAAKQIRFLMPAEGVPTSANFPDQTLLLLAQGVVAVGRAVEQLQEQNKPRPRGRPPKDRKQEADNA